MVLTKTKRAFDHLKAQFKARTVQKRYYAVLQGVLSGSGG